MLMACSRITTSKITNEIKTSEKITTTESIKEMYFDEKEYLEGVSERREFLREYILARHKTNYSAKWGFGVAYMELKMYEETKDETYLNQARTQIGKCFDYLEKNPDCFNIFYAIYNYGLCKEYYTEEMLEKAKRIFINTSAYGMEPSTTNHALMFAVATYLANQYFKDEIKTPYFGYDSADRTDPTAEKTVKMVLKNYPITGVYECNSDTYFLCHFYPMLALSRLAEDDTVKNMALVNVENSLFTLAPIWLNGHTVIGKERCYQPFLNENEGGQATNLLWYYFGERKENPSYTQLDNAETGSLAWAITDEFLPNWISVLMARDRSETYTHKECHITSKTRNGVSSLYYEFLESYINKNYGVFTMKPMTYPYNSFIKLIRGFDRLNWGVNWLTDDPNEYSTFNIINWDKEFNNQHIQIGATPFQDVLQNEGTVIGVFDIPDSTGFSDFDGVYTKYATLSMPNNYKAIRDYSSINGTMYVHFGNILIGFKTSVNFIYDNTKNFNNLPEFPNGKGYFLCEVMSASEVEGKNIEEQLDYFESLCTAKFRNVIVDYSKETKIVYTSINGVKMELSCISDNVITNGKINDVSLIYDIFHYPSQDNPWIKANVNDKLITYNYKGATATFDFNNYTFKEGILK